MERKKSKRIHPIVGGNNSSKDNVSIRSSELTNKQENDTIVNKVEKSDSTNGDSNSPKNSSGENSTVHQRLSQSLSDTIAQSLDQMPKISAKLMSKIKRASKKGVFLERMRRHSKTKRQAREKDMLRHIALLQRFKIRDHEEDIIEKGLIEAERKLSLSHSRYKAQHSVLHRWNPSRIFCSPKRVIEPNSKIRKGLNFLQSLCMLYIAFILPFELFFVHYEPRTYSFSSRPISMVTIELVADIVFILNFISRFYSK